MIVIVKRRNCNFTKIILALFFLVSVVLPLICMFANLFTADLDKIFGNKSFFEATLHSLQVSAVSTVISISLAFLLAWCMTRTKVKLKGFFSAVIILPMLIPSISHGMGLVILFGQNGQLTKLLV